MLFQHHSKYYSVLQVGMDMALSLPKVCGVLHGNTRGLIGSVFSKQKKRELKLKYLKKLFNNNNIVCLQEVHGKDEYLQAIQVLAPRFRFFGTFSSFLKTKNAGGSAVCIQRDLLAEEATVTHLITCQGRDHIVHIQSGRQKLSDRLRPF